MSKLRDSLREQETYYGMACAQLTLLNERFEQLAKRYDIADKLGQKSFRYSLKLRMSVLEGVRKMFFRYATFKACHVNEIRHEILIEHAISENNGDHTYSYPLLGRYANPIFHLSSADSDETDDEVEEDEDSYDTETESGDETDDEVDEIEDYYDTDIDSDETL